MTEEEARQENGQQPQQPNEDLENPKILKNRVGEFLASGLSFKGRKEKEIMTNEEARQENMLQQQPMSAQNLEDPEFPKEPETPEEQAREQFKEIKEALKGPKSDDQVKAALKTWSLPEPDRRALASQP